MNISQPEKLLIMGFINELNLPSQFPPENPGKGNILVLKNI